MGVIYVQKQNIETYLLMGIDDLGIAKKEEGDYGNGQSDVMMVLVLDNSEDTWRLLQLNRDTMYNVPIINDWGDITGVQFEQICLAHAYGKNLNAGCRNATQMVSGMLWNQPINGYVSMNMGKPGITKRQHWHHTKWEFFIVVKGHILIQERRIGDDEVREYEVSGDRIQAVMMLPGYTHNIINLSDSEELVTLMWANECFDPNHPDTYFEPVK